MLVLAGPGACRGRGGGACNKTLVALASLHLHRLRSTSNVQHPPATQPSLLPLLRIHASGCCTPCPNTGLSKHGDPVFPHFWAFFGTIVFAVPIQ